MKSEAKTTLLDSRDPRVECALEAAVDAIKPDRIQGFLYGDEYVIRDTWQPRGPEQEVWRGPGNDMEGFCRQCEIERMRVAIGAFMSMIAEHMT